MEVVSDATSSLSNGLKKSIQTCSKEAAEFARSLGEIVDVEDIVKTIHKVANPEEYEDRKSFIVHKPIGLQPLATKVEENNPIATSADDEAKHVTAQGLHGVGRMLQLSIEVGSDNNQESSIENNSNSNINKNISQKIRNWECNNSRNNIINQSSSINNSLTKKDFGPFNDDNNKIKHQKYSEKVSQGRNNSNNCTATKRTLGVTYNKSNNQKYKPKTPLF